MRRAVVCVAALLSGCGGKHVPAPPSNEHSGSGQPAQLETASEPEPLESGQPPPPDVEPARAAAQAAAVHAAKEAHERHQEVMRLARELEALDDQLAVAVDELMASQSDGERATAKARLESLRDELAELRARLQQAKSAAERAERARGAKLPPACVDDTRADDCRR